MAKRPKDAPPKIPASPGRNKAPPASVGLRAAVPKTSASEKTIERGRKAREAVSEARASRRQAVWNKLDAARDKANAKAARLEKFKPERTASKDDLDL